MAGIKGRSAKPIPVTNEQIFNILRRLKYANTQQVVSELEKNGVNVNWTPLNNKLLELHKSGNIEMKSYGTKRTYRMWALK